MAYGTSSMQRGATPSTRAVAFAAFVLVLGLIGWRSMDVLTRAPSSPGPLSQAEASLLSVAEAITGKGHVRVSVAQRSGQPRQVLVLVDEAVETDPAILVQIVTAAAAIDDSKGEIVSLKQLPFAAGMTGQPTLADWTELSLLGLLACLIGWLGFRPSPAMAPAVEIVREALPSARMAPSAPAPRPAAAPVRSGEAADLARRDPARAAEIVRGWMGKPGDAA
ncbi:MAG: hypothetical protein R3C13_11425 [Hyphomonas sp.]|uniref:hypothetical protein n=1 Tax=Hyphomonas sp. TaxID=87 RepID=UPI0035271633